MTDSTKPKATFQSIRDRYALEDLHRGDAKLFADIVEAFDGPLRQRLSGMIGHHTVPSTEDVFQDTMLLLWQYKETLEDFTYLPGFVYKMARNSCINTLKKPSNRTKAADMTGQVPPGKNGDLLCEVEAYLTVCDVYQAAKNLPPVQYETLMMSYKKDCGDDVIAEKMGIRESTVRSNRGRAVANLKKIYTPEP